MTATVLPMTTGHVRLIPAVPDRSENPADAMVETMRGLWANTGADLTSQRDWLLTRCVLPSTTPARRRCADLLLAYLTATGPEALCGLVEPVVIAADDLATLTDLGGAETGEHPLSCCGHLDRPYEGEAEACEQKLCGLRDDALDEAMAALSYLLGCNIPSWALATVSEAAS